MRYFTLLTLFILTGNALLSQMYILNEDFANTNLTTPPPNWSNINVSGTPNDLWHFDNPGNRQVNYPVTYPFAIFDSEAYSQDATPEEAILETPFFDASVSNNILLTFHQLIQTGISTNCQLFAFDGADWHLLSSFNQNTANPQQKIIDISEYCGGVTNAKLRFKWSGNSSGFWVIDNIRIVSPLPYDAGIVSIDEPENPFQSGVRDVSVTLGNFGYEDITSTKIQWLVNGVEQNDKNWTGNLSFGETESGIVLGNYNFAPGVYEIIVWQSNPNGQNDPNHLNDTCYKILAPSLCGEYTVGGVNPDFEDLEEVETALNISGITCPVIFNIRNGNYTENISLNEISGSSSENTITFRSENLDPAKVTIEGSAFASESIFMLNSTSNIVFEYLGFGASNQAAFHFKKNASNFQVVNCLFNEYSNVISDLDESAGIVFADNEFVAGGFVKISNQHNSSISQVSFTGNLATGESALTASLNDINDSEISNNEIENGSITVNSSFDNVIISENIVSGGGSNGLQANGNGIDRIFGNKITGIKNSVALQITDNNDLMVYNNFLQSQDENATGIDISNCNNVEIYYNSINIASESDNTKALNCNNVLNAIIENNIFSNPDGTCAVMTDSDPALSVWDYNDYFNKNNRTAIYDEDVYTGLESWRSVCQGEENGLEVNPYYTSVTDLSINHVLLNNHALAIDQITYDIDNTLRNPVAPDIGAREYEPCYPDAGIDKVTEPENPVSPGVHDVVVRLQNQGSGPLSSATIKWSVEGVMQADFSWSGNLEMYENEHVNIGTYNFPDYAVDILAWTELPNGEEDCNNYNDTVVSKIYGPMCGEYTIGGIAPDFPDFYQAVEALKIRGISCPVTFYVRDGEYTENVIIPLIEGVSNEDTITFLSENHDSTLVTITSADPDSDYIFMFDNSRYISFMELGFDPSDADIFRLVDQSGRININSNLMHSYGMINLSEGNHDSVNIKRNRFLSGGMIAGIAEEGNENSTVVISKSISDDYLLIDFDNVDNIIVSSNATVAGRISLLKANSGNCVVVNNRITSSENGGLSLTGNAFSQISGNWISGINDGVGFHGEGITNALIFNNFINTSGSNSNECVLFEEISNCQIFFNTFSVFSIHPSAITWSLIDVSNNSIIDNIFSNSNAGICLFLETDPALNEWDFNDYYSHSGNLAYYNNTLLSDLSSWRAISSGDQNSLAFNPSFSSPESVYINNVQLDNKGTPYLDITYDIEADPRNLMTPDMGAKEFSPCYNDVALEMFANPQNPVAPENQEIRLIITNNGIDNLQTLTIEWFINGVQQDDFTWTGDLPTGLSEEVIIGSYDFSEGIYYEIQATGVHPNGLEDCCMCNNTIEKFFAKPLCGVYTIGGIEPDFPDFTLTGRALNVAGISCSVIFKVRDGEYTDNLLLSNVPGVSEEATITYESESGDSSKVLINNGNPAYPAVFEVIKTSFITFNQLGFNEIQNKPLLFNKDLQDIVVSNCYFENMGNITFRDACSNIYVLRNYFDKGGVVNFQGSSGNPDHDIIVYGNIITGNTSSYITCNNVTATLIDSNYIHRGQINVRALDDGDVRITRNNIRQGNVFGIFTRGKAIREISRNRVVNIYGTGIYSEFSKELDIVNNFVQVKGSGQYAGIQFNHGDESRVVFNSVNNLSDHETSRALDIYDAAGMVIKNNILSSREGGYPVYVINVENYDWDFNDYYSSSGFIGYLNGTTYNNLNEWGQAINGDANSKTLNPFYISETNLRPHQRELNGAGITIPGILLDIDGEIRNDVAPDIGADEFMVDFGVTQLLSPTLDCNHSDIDSVTVYLRQFGDIPFINIQIAYQVNGGDIFYNTIPGTITNDIEFTFDVPVNISEEGEYLFKIWLLNTQDDNFNNDTLIATRYSYPAPIVDFSWDNYCTWTEVRFEGEAEISNPYTIENYEWDFGDGELGLGQNSTHKYEDLGVYPVKFMAYTNKGCYGDTTKNISITMLPVSMEFDVKNETCKWDCTGEVNINASGGQEPYKYYLDGIEIFSTQLDHLCYGDHLLSITDNLGCEFIDTFNITSEVVVDLDFELEPGSGFAPLEVQMDYTGEGAEDLQWFFGDGSSDTGSSAKNIYFNFGTYQVMLTGNSGAPYYCIDTAFREVVVEVDVKIEAPSLITPNNDGYNDVFEFYTFGVRELKAYIYNRWGILVYEIPDIESVWDGKDENGKDAPDGVYYYAVEAIGQDGMEYEENGAVTLLRKIIEISPNPASESAMLKLTGEYEGVKKLNIFDNKGIHVLGVEFVGGEYKLDISDMESGMYFIKVLIENNYYYTKLLKK